MRPITQCMALLVCVGCCLGANFAAGDELTAPAVIKRTMDGRAIEIEPHAIYVGRNQASRIAARMVVVDLTIRNKSSETVSINLSESFAKLNGVAQPALTSLYAIRFANFQYFGSRYKIEREDESSTAVWKIHRDHDVEELDGDDFGGLVPDPRDRAKPDVAGPPDEPIPGERLTDDSPSEKTDRRAGSDDEVFSTESQLREILPGESLHAILTFNSFPEGRIAPTVTLVWPNLSAPIDLVEWSVARANVSTSRIGPKECIGIVHLAGPVDRLGLVALCDAIDRLAVQNVRRAVISFEAGSSISEPKLAQWLRLSLVNSRSSRVTYQDIMSLPPSMHDMAVADEADAVLPSLGGDVPGTAGLVSERLDQAIAHVAESVASRLERDDIVSELRFGESAGMKAALLRSAAYRLRPRDLPLVLAMADDRSADVRIAAIAALAQFESPAAVDRLLQGLESDSLIARRAAVSSLMTIESEAATEWRDRLAEAVSDDAVGLGPLADEPIEAWRDVFRKAMKAEADDLQLVGVRGLMNLGGPEAKQVMQKAIVDGDSQVKQFVVRKLRESNDVEWAIEIALKQLSDGKADEPLLDLLADAKPRACLQPLLQQLPEFRHGMAVRSIRLIGSLAGAEEEAELARLVPTLESAPARQALEVLFERRSPHRFDVAKQLFNSDNGSLERALVSYLGRDGTVTSEEILCDRFLASEKQAMWPLYKEQLKQMGGERVHETLRQVLVAGDVEKQPYAYDARWGLWYRSPAARLVDNAIALQSTRTLEKFEEAEVLFAKALALDPDYTPGLNSRAMLYLQWPTGARLDDALADYKLAVQRGPAYASPLIGLGLVYASDNDAAAAVEPLEKIPEWLRNRMPVDEYNVACVYGILHQKLTAESVLSKEQAARAAELKNQALEALEAAIAIGFTSGSNGAENLAHMQKDSDLTSLHGPEFDDIVKQAKQRDDG